MKLSVKSEKNVVAYAILVWFVVNLLQAIFTNLHSDEVYYWTYSWKLQWAYWGNAPLIGLYIYIGDFIFPYTEIGVRLITVFSGTLAIYLVWLCTDRKDPYLFFALLFGMALIHAGGFMAAPDAPLALANAALLLSYKKFIERNTILHAMVFGLAAAMVMYSKYQGAMLIGMLALSNPKLFFRKEMWVSVLVFALAFAPGFMALYNMEFSTFQYHLSEKNPESWQWNWTSDFILSQFLVAGPFVGFILLPLLFIQAPQSKFLKSLRISAIGIYLFLLAISFKVYVFSNWSASVLFPLLLVGYDGLQSRIKLRNWALRLGLAGLVFACIARIYIASTLPLPTTLNFHFRNWDTWAEEMHSIAGDKPVVFFNTFQLPSRYAFYNHTHNVFTLSNFYYHPTQFDYGDIEESLQGEEVFLVSGYNYGTLDSVQDKYHGNFYLYYINNFCSGQMIQITTSKKEYTVSAGTQVTIPIIILPPPKQLKENIDCTDYKFFPAYHIRNGNTYYTQSLQTDFPLDIHSMDTVQLQLQIQVPYETGTYDLLFSIGTDWKIPYFGKNGEWLKLTVED